MSDRQQLLEDARYVRNLQLDNESMVKAIADLGIGLHTLKTQNAALVEALRACIENGEFRSGVGFEAEQMARAALAHAMPDIETFRASAVTCPMCSRLWQHEPMGGVDVPKRCDCGEDLTDESPENGWWWVSCFPGCLPDSDPMGPFASEAEALASADDTDDRDEDRGSRCTQGCGWCGACS